jgi:hypothetical protein
MPFPVVLRPRLSVDALLLVRLPVVLGREGLEPPSASSPAGRRRYIRRIRAIGTRAGGAGVRTLIVRSREDLQIAADVRRAPAADATVVGASTGGRGARRP